jgi:hypothetical protein
MRRLLLPLAAALLAILAARPASAEEVVILDTGAVLRGMVVRETEDQIVLRLSGFAHEASVTVQRARIVRRFVAVERAGATSPATSLAPEVDPIFDTTPSYEIKSLPTFADPVEPPPSRESFFQRLARVVVMAIPTDPAGRASLTVLFLVALLTVVGMGGRIADIETMGIGRATILAAVLGAILVADVLYYPELLRADRAPWVLLGQGALWLGAAAATLRVGFGRTVLLFAFVLFSLTLVVFTAGAILMSF